MKEMNYRNSVDASFAKSPGQAVYSFTYLE